MTNLEKYTDVFVKKFNISAEAVEELKYQDISAWDSVGHMELIANIEDAFDIMFEADDIIALSSFKVGKEILSNNYGIEF